ncbi:MAG: hypothetical protein AAB527_00385 [Patescibacteria group bacterium]
MKKAALVALSLIVSATILLTHYEAAIRDPSAKEEELSFIRKRVGTIIVPQEHSFEILPRDAKEAGEKRTETMKLANFGRAFTARMRGNKMLLTSGHTLSPPIGREISMLESVFAKRNKIDESKFEVRYKSTEVKKESLVFRIGDNIYKDFEIKFLLFDEIGQDFAILAFKDAGKIPKEYFKLGSTADLNYGDTLFMAGGSGSSPANIFLVPAIFEENQEVFIQPDGSIGYGQAVMTLSGAAVAAGASGSPILKKDFGCSKIYCYRAVGIVRSIIGDIDDARLHSHTFHAARIELVKEAADNIVFPVKPKEGEKKANWLEVIRTKTLSFDRMSWVVFGTIAAFAILLLLIFKPRNTYLSYLVASVLIVLISLSVYFGIRSSLGWPSRFIPENDLLLVDVKSEPSNKRAYLLVREKLPSGEFSKLRLLEVIYEPGSSSAKELDGRIQLLKKGKGTILRLKRLTRGGAFKTPELSEFEFHDFLHENLPPKKIK